MKYLILLLVSLVACVCPREPIEVNPVIVNKDELFPVICPAGMVGFKPRLINGPTVHLIMIVHPNGDTAYKTENCNHRKFL